MIDIALLAALLPFAVSTWLRSRRNARRIRAIMASLGIDPEASPEFDVRADGGWLPDGASESDTARDGLLSYASEWHAAILGLGFGAAGGWLGQPEVAGVGIAVALGLGAAKRVSQTVAGELRREPWYAVGGVLLGYAPAVVLRLVS